MKRVIFIVVITIHALSVFAQREYHNGRRTVSDYKSDTLYMENYAYIADTLAGVRISLYNLQNHPGRGEIAYADGSWLDTTQYPWNLPDFYVVSDATLDYMHSVVDNAFSVQQADSLDGREMRIVLNLSSVDGSVTDVYFNFPSFYYYTKIPVSVFREIEVKLKQLIFELTDEGRRLTYCLLSWMQCPTGYVEPTLDPDVPFDGGSGGEGNVQTGPRGSIITEPMVPAK
ncbi:MAG: DUF5043 domain-containing protein [Tidjanibacter sp.]|nr:DUF5043 domain-containing protein [Tidjanibacter sp.]